MVMVYGVVKVDHIIISYTCIYIQILGMNLKYVPLRSNLWFLSEWSFLHSVP